MKATKKSTPRVNPPKGTHIAILTQILDWGTQHDVYGDRRKVELIWELPEELHVFNEERGEEPFIVDRKFALTISKKAALKEALEGMTGAEIVDDEIELEQFLETVCQLQINIVKDGEYENVDIQSYMQLGKNDQKRIKSFKAVGEVKCLDLDNFDEAVFNSLPDWKQKLIATSPEYKEAVANSAPSRTPVKSTPASSKNSAKPTASTSKAKDLFKGKGKK